MSSERTIFHIDMNAFFAAVEQVTNPAYRGRPLIVGGDPDRRGVVSTASYEARRFGIKAGMSLWEARRLCPNGIFVQGNPARYLDISLRLLNLYQSFTPLVEPFSIDEAFLDVTGSAHLFGGSEAMAREIKRRMRQQFDLTASIGLAPNKLLAKMASDLQKPDGLVILRREDVPRRLWTLPVGELYGVGEKMGRHLVDLGLTTIGALAQAPVQLLRHYFGVVGETLHQMANGLDDSPVDPYAGLLVKSMGHELTLPADTDDREVIGRTLLQLSDQVGRRLRRDGYQGRKVTVKIRQSDFVTITRDQTMDEYTDLEEVIYETAHGLFVKNWPGWPKIRLLGVSVSGLVNARRLQQLSFWDDRDRLSRVTRAVDAIRDKYGEGAVLKARLLVPARLGKAARPAP
ncbi:MAG: DNA polymerase IV [Firmicutes bacterium]|nr:DNA polymerase IV [Bacillota bacterium]MCL5038919.1 DNA polymerase IV [Bacillota bacterium]